VIDTNQTLKPAEMPAEVAPLWRRLGKDPSDIDTMDALVRHYQPLVRSEVSRARSRFPSHIDMEELETAALEALFMALRDFDINLGCSFEGYSKKRIWGAMVDRVRGLDGIPRTALRAAKVLAGADTRFRQRNGRTPDLEELAAEVGVSPEHLARLERQAKNATKLSLDVSRSNGAGDESGAELMAVSNLRAKDDNPLHNLADAELKHLLVEGLKALPERERSILVLYYHEGIMFTEIAAAMEVSESRVSQIHTRALERLKRYLVFPTAREAADERTKSD